MCIYEKWRWKMTNRDQIVEISFNWCDTDSCGCCWTSVQQADSCEASKMCDTAIVANSVNELWYEPFLRNDGNDVLKFFLNLYILFFTFFATERSSQLINMMVSYWTSCTPKWCYILLDLSAGCLKSCFTKRSADSSEIGYTSRNVLIALLCWRFS